MKQISAAMFLTAALSLGVSAFAQTTPTNPTGQVDQPTGQAAPQKPADLKDVPAGHWAQEAIKIAADCGIIRGYPDGTFRGNQPITRYEAAAIVARLITAIKSGACGIGTAGTSGFMITEEQYNDLMSAVQELQADLAQLGVRVAELEDNAVTQDDLARVEELATQARDIAEQAASTADDAAAAAADAADAAAAAQEAADAAQEAADAAQAAADANTEAIQAAQDAADAAQEAADAAQASADDALDFIGTITVSDGGEASVDLDTLATVDDVAALQDQIDALQEAIDGMEPAEGFDPTELQGQLDDLTGTVDDLQSQIDDLNAQIADLGAGDPTEPAAEFDATDLQDQIDDLQAQIADTQDQISALTDAVNAQQETVDGLVDAVAGTQDDIGTLQDTVADLQAQIDALGGSTEGAQDLMDAIDAASIAADTALAQSRELQDKVDELDGRVTDLESGLGELGATVESQADSIAALNDLVVLLNQDVLSLQDRVTQLERQVEELSGVAPVEPGVDLTDDLDSLREFTTLLRRDQTALADTVGDLEARVGALETKVDTGLAALDKRVSALENNGFSISGTIRLDYYVSRLWFANGKGVAPDFDIDRLGFTTYFTSGDIVDSKNGDDSSTFYGDFNFDYIQNYAADDQPGVALGYFTGVNNAGSDTYQYEGTVYPGLSLTFGFKARPLVEASGEFNTFSIKLTLSLDKKSPFTNPQGAGQGNNVTLGTFKITGLASQFKVGAAPVFINFGINPAFKFTNYGFNNGGGRGSGFVATADGAGLLPLNPTLTIVYGSTGGINDDSGNGFVVPFPGISDLDDRYHVGLYGTLSLIPGLTGGVYYGYEGTDVIANTVYNNTVYGLGFSGKVFGFLGLEGEWNVSKLNGLANAQVAAYTKVSLALDPFTVGGNFRYVDAQFNGIGTSDSPYKLNQKGFGVNAGLANLFGFLSLSAYYDSYARVDNTAGALPDNSGGAATNSRTTFGVKLGFRLIGFDITGYVDRVNELNNSGNATTGLTYDRTKAGVDLKHDGSKSDALIGGLNLALGYNSQFDGLNGAAAATTFTRLYAYADLSLKFGDFNITPRGWFNTTTQGNGGNTTDLGGRLDINAPFLFGSKLALGAAIDQTTRNAAAGGINSGTTWLKAGLAWDSFLLPNSSLSVYFGLRNDTNRAGITFGPSFKDPYGPWGADYANTSTSLAGLYFEFTYYGLGFYYGIFQLTNTPGLVGGDPVRFGQAFAISYALKF